MMRKLTFLFCFGLLFMSGIQLLMAQVKLSPDGLYPDYLAEVNGSLLFLGYDENTGWELWKSDGTAAGTEKVTVLTASWALGPTTVVGDILFISLYNEMNGRELWKSDGSATGTGMVKDIFPGNLSSNPTQFTAIDGLLYFSADDGVHGRELWKSDGTAEGTVMVKDINAGDMDANPVYLYEFGSSLVFYVSGGINSGLWKSDGTLEGTIMIKKVHLYPPGGGAPYPGGETYRPYFTDVGGTLFFNAYSHDLCFGEYELWKSDGTTEGTGLVKDIYICSSSFPAHLVSFNNTLFFSARDVFYGRELWKSDGTAEGTTMFKEIMTGWNSSNPEKFIDVNGVLFFRAIEGNSGQELWKSDGTLDGTVLVKDISPGYAYSYPDYLTAFDGTLFFQATDPINGYELWKSNGTAEGTVLIKDINPGTPGGYPRNLTNVDGTLFFTAYDGTGRYLWKYSPCEIANVLALDRSDCYPIYNTYTQDLEITFSNPPQEGNLIVNGQSFPIGTSPQTITLTGLIADELPVSVHAYFESKASCYFDVPGLFTAPSPCNSPPEIIGSMLEYIQSLIDAGILTPSGNGLSPQLQQILVKIDQGKIEEAISQLQGFIEHVIDLRDKDGVLDPEQAQVLLDGANAVLDQLTEGTPLFGLTAPQPESIKLGQNFPNPFSDETLIPFSISTEEPVSLKVYRVTGELIQTLLQDVRYSGHYQIRLQAGELPEGIYYYTLQTGQEWITKRMIVIK